MTETEITEAERCRILLSRTSGNSAPAIGIIDAKLRACGDEKSEVVGSRLSTNPLKNDSLKQKQQGLNAAGSYYRVLPEITRRQDGNIITRKKDYFKDTISDIIFRHY